MNTRFSGKRAVKLIVWSLTLLAALLVLAGMAALQARADGGAFPTVTPSFTPTFTLIPTQFPTATSTFPVFITPTSPYPYPYSLDTEIQADGEAPSGGGFFGLSCWPIALLFIVIAILGASALLRRGGGPV